MITTEEFLAHHGVKGQRWGVRKNKSGKKREPLSKSEIAGKVVTAGLLAAIGTTTLAAIGMGR